MNSPTNRDWNNAFLQQRKKAIATFQLSLNAEKLCAFNICKDFGKMRDAKICKTVNNKNCSDVKSRELRQLALFNLCKGFLFQPKVITVEKRRTFATF